MEKQEFSKYERARIIGARGLQVSMDAPLLLEMDEKSLEEINYDPLKIAEKELDSGVLPISVNKPMPQRREEDIEKIKIEESKITDAEKEKVELEEEKAIAESGEIMKLSSEEENSNEESLSPEKPSQEIEA
jgi:DNA-directed RNA polymerase subunit K/omega